MDWGKEDSPRVTHLSTAHFTIALVHPLLLQDPTKLTNNMAARPSPSGYPYHDKRIRTLAISPDQHADLHIC